MIFTMTFCSKTRKVNKINRIKILLNDYELKEKKENQEIKKSNPKIITKNI